MYSAFSCVNLISIHCSYSFLIKNKNQKAWWCYQVRKEFPIPVICMDNDTKMKKKKNNNNQKNQGKTLKQLYSTYLWHIINEILH